MTGLVRVAVLIDVTVVVVIAEFVCVAVVVVRGVVYPSSCEQNGCRLWDSIIDVATVTELIEDDEDADDIDGVNDEGKVVDAGYIDVEGTSDTEKGADVEKTDNDDEKGLFVEETANGKRLEGDDVKVEERVSAGLADV